jgi:acyl carrier protein
VVLPKNKLILKIMNQYLNQIKKLIAEKAGLEIDEVDLYSYFEDDLNIDELSLIEIIGEVEELFKIELIEYKDDIETVQDLLESITEQIE